MRDQESAAQEHAVQRPPFDLCDRTFQFALRILALCSGLKKLPGVGWLMSKQLFRAGTSIGANIEEGQAAQSRADFIAKYSIARKEARETRYWLRILVASNLKNTIEVRGLTDETKQLVRILTSSIKKAQSHQTRST